MTFVNRTVDDIHFETDNGCRIAQAITDDPQSPKLHVVVDGQLVSGYDDVAWHSLKFSPDGKHVAFVATNEGKQVCVLDGKSGEKYDKIGGSETDLVFSPDSQHLGYAAQKNNKWVVVVDGVAGSEFDRVDGMGITYHQKIFVNSVAQLKTDIAGSSSCPIFTADSQHFFYLTISGQGKDREYCVVLDGKSGPEFSRFFGANLSPDGHHMAYAGAAGNEYEVVYDGVAGPSAAGVGSIIYSTDSSHIAYVAGQYRQSQQVVVDGVPGKEFRAIARDSLQFSPDEKHVVYGGFINDNYKVEMVDDQPVPTGWRDPIYSSDGQHTAYVTQNKNQKAVKLDDSLGPEFDDIYDVMFSPNGRQLVYEAKKANALQVVFNGEAHPIPEGSYAYNLTISPDGRHLAYSIQKAGPRPFKHADVLDGVEGPAFDEIENDSIKFSTDSKHLRFIAEQNNKKEVVTDGVAGPEFDQIAKGHPFDSPDGNHYAYAGKKDELWQVVVDGKPGPDLYNVDLESIKFSADDQRLIYAALIGYQQSVVVNTTPGPKFDEIRKGSITLSADGQHYAYVAKVTNNQWQAVVDGTAGPSFIKIDDKNVLFSSDSKHWAYVAQTNSGQELVVDGKPGPQFGNIAVGPVECKDGRLEYLAFESNGDKTNLVRVTVPGFGPAKP